MAASTRHPGMLWAHNDSGHPADLFLLDTTGQTVATFRVAGIRNRDWEDIAIGPGKDSTATLFIGDIGDNRQEYPVKYIYCVREPGLETSGDVAVLDTLIIRLDDRPRDTEALLIDPLTQNLYLVSKLEHDVRVYEIAYPYEGDTITVAPALELPMRHITAGDISRDGNEILLKSYTSVYYWKRLPGQSVLEALQQEPFELDYQQEPQGESIAWAPDGSGFYTLSENGKGERGRLLFYVRRVPAAAQP